MSSLTEEQKKKIEESRRKALAIKAAKAQHKPTLEKNVPPVKPGTPSAIAKAVFKKRPDLPSWLGTKSNGNAPRVQSTGGAQNSKILGDSPQSLSASYINGRGRGTSKYGATNHSKSPNKRQHDTKPLNDDVASTSHSPLKSSLASNLTKVKGRCVLTSREQFMVDIGYSAPLVALFKTMQTKQYDMVTKKWSFELREYRDFMNTVRHLSDTVTIEPLPHCVLSTFDKAIHGLPQPRYIPEADLSGVDLQLVNGLFPFQKDGVNFGISHNGRVLIADDMGLGKTIQALCIAGYYRREWPLLIVVPSSVRFAWKEQILRWLPSVDEQDISVIVTGKENSTSGYIVIISYDLMVRRQKELLGRQFKVIIMDESHFLKNNKTARTQSAFPLLKKAKRVLLLSGTPALSRPSELFMQLSAVDNQLFPRFHQFGLRYCNGKKMQWGWDFTGSSNLAELQLVLEENIMIRRLKQDVLDELPSKIRQMVVLDPSSVKIGREMKISHKFIDKAKGSDRRSALLEYFHETGTAKKQAVKEYIMDHLEAGNKILFFAHHQEVLDTIEEAVAKKYKYIRIDGRTAAEQRNVLCDRFQKKSEVRIAILSICAANAGLNLMAASLVIFGELFWNPGILVQAEDRAHRIGQQDSVNVHYLVASGTADDFIWPLVQAKLDVLSKAGLSKENFTEAHTTHFKDPKQKDILSYFDESFFEDDMILLEEDVANDSERDNQTGYENQLNVSKSDQAAGEGSSRMKEDVSNTSITASSDQPQNDEEEESDWLDDECFKDVPEMEEDPGDPPAKKARTG
ncbi:hypothetical protein LSH36_200g01004 [Paralvinella palmiformis]|uniref:SWI/SNF-related matrix-associated actin-dependent regulator of chromatin subfamily A-like protein 1 n=1 Tax=Paralvinella palmiformis TaxID=53620 RepID=A0AAD9JRU6_9ANNE|nr:hypothetical protein LSH36_200g01004 [Paralvinella palmiformis]